MEGDKNIHTSKLPSELPEGSMERKQEEQGPSTALTPPETSAKHSPVYWMGQTRDGASTSSGPPKGYAQCNYKEPPYMPIGLVAMDTCKELHEAIAGEDQELVRRILRDHPAEKHFLYKGSSALYKAFSCKEYNIACYLISSGGKFDDYENLHNLEIDLTHVNYLLLDYNKKHEKSCIFQLLSYSQSRQGLDGEQLNSVMIMFEDFFESEILKLVMKVVETTALDIVYDFESEDINRIHRYAKNDCKIYGLTLTCSKEIFIGAKGLLSGDSQKRAKVYGVVAEELCHLALTTLFENQAKPYREEDSDLEKDFQKIVLGVKSLVNRSCHIESVIVDVFRNYPVPAWDCELIARIPHVIGIYGEKYGRKKFMEYPELQEILHFYEENVIPKFKVYCEPSMNKKAHKIIEELRKKNDLLSYKEKTIQPLKQGFPSFTEYYSLDEDGISVITANCTKLCMLHVYHELKMKYHELERKYKDLFMKECLFFSREYFDSECEEILNALKVNGCKYFTLVLDERELNLQRLKGEYLCHLQEFKSKGMQIIVISGLNSFGDEFQSKALNYEWKDLSSEYQEFRTCPIVYHLKGEKKVTSVEKEDVPKVFSEIDILRLISGESFVIEDGAEMESRRFILETYLAREFKVMAVNRNFFQNLPSDTSIFIYGLCRWQLKELSIDQTLVQWLYRSDDKIQRGKKIFIIEEEKSIPFGEFVRKTPGEKCICLHFMKNEFILRNPDSLGEVLKKYKKEIKITEEEMIDLIKTNKILIIADNAGCGKTTVTSSLVRLVKRNIYYSLVFRIDLWKFSLHDDFDVENGDDEDLFDEIFQMIGLNNGFQRWHFRKSGNQGAYFLFFDGYDEIPSKYKNKALSLISFLRRSTYVNIFITTRRHDQQELEEKLNTYSHQLVPFNYEEQLNCLGKLLKWKLKYPFGDEDHTSKRNEKAISRKIKNIIKELEKEENNLECLILALKKIELGGSLDSLRIEIDKLDLNKLVVNILKKSQLEERIIEFMGIPLHLYMVGSILYSDNFNMQIGSDFHSLYSKFIAQKILIYVEEKEGLVREGIGKDRLVESVREDAFKIHIELANQLFDEGERINIKKEDKDLCSALGIVSIHNGEILFLHQTFAEYFKAESIRKNIEKKVFVEMLFIKKYEVVRRFLCSALEKKNFENLPKGFFKDLDFLIEIMKRICTLRKYYYPYEIDSDNICCLKIVKILLEEFKSTDEQILFKNFIERLNELVKEEERRKAIKIGGCLTLEMMKHLMIRNFKVNSNLILFFVRFSENVEEVMDVLHECILKTTESGGSRGNEELVLEMLRIKDSDGDGLYGLRRLTSHRCGLFSYAACNKEGKIFPQLLKYFKNVLGDEQFMRKVIESEEYTEQMKLFAINVHTNRNCRLINEMHSVFAKEVNILFEIDFKFCVIVKAVEYDSDEDSGNLFENVINLFIECFGIENLCEVLLKKYFNGEHLVHYLMEMCTNANLIKYFNLINDILGDKMKKFLKSKNRYLTNIFHFAAKNKNEINFDFLNLYLCENEIEELLVGVNKFGLTCLHVAAKNNLRKLTAFLNYVHEKTNSESYLEEFLLAKDENGDTFLHLLGRFPFYNPSEEIKVILNALRLNVSDELFKELLRVRNGKGKTFLQVEFKEEVIEYVKEVLEKDLFE